ncbi:MAG: hypothetical protein ACFFG0_53225, partial [Candidatus Thorarchaeota archaeon]
PLDLVPRRCYCCENPLSFNDYRDSNKEMNLIDLMALWQNEYVELLCCRCHMRLNKYNKLLNGDPSILEENYISERMTQISRLSFLTNLQTIAENSDGRVRKLFKLIKSLEL